MVFRSAEGMTVDGDRRTSGRTLPTFHMRTACPSAENAAWRSDSAESNDKSTPTDEQTARKAMPDGNTPVARRRHHHTPMARTVQQKSSTR
ncbi:MAG: hypothetical protein D6741_00970, partial [Planctomycetota bacterium]